MSSDSNTKRLPEEYVPQGELTEAIHTAWRVIDQQQIAQGKRADLATFAAAIGCQAQVVWKWLTCGKAPGTKSARALVRILPAAKDVLEQRGLLDERKRVNRGDRRFSLMAGRAQTSKQADEQAWSRRRDAKIRALRADRLHFIRERARALGIGN